MGLEQLGKRLAGHMATLQSCTCEACIPGIDDKLELSWGPMPLKGLPKWKVCFRHVWDATHRTNRL